MCLHLTAFLSGPTGSLWGASTVCAPGTKIVARGDGTKGPWSLLVNLRVLTDPSKAAQAMREELDRSAARTGLSAAVDSLEVFLPPFPVPTYRERRPVAGD